MGKFVTMNFSGRFIIEPRRQTGKDVADQPIFSPEIAIVPTRMGVDEAGKVLGFFDTATMLSPETQEYLKTKYGDKWLETFDEKVHKGPYNLRLLREGEKIEVNGIPIEPLNPADAKRMPKSRRATVIQGPITAGAFAAGPRQRMTLAEEIPDKVVEKMLPAAKEKVRE